MNFKWFWRIIVTIYALHPDMVSAALFAHVITQVTHKRVRQGDWRLEIAWDRFSGGVACQLHSFDDGEIYRAVAVGFRFSSGWDVARAVYRLDGGAARTARDDLPRLIEFCVPIDRSTLDHAANGIGWISFELLANADNIAIEPRPGKRVRQFHIRGLGALHDTAMANGCVPEGRFVEQ